VKRGVAPWVAAVAWLGTGCSEVEGPSDCLGDVELQVAEGPIPVFTWSPVCEVATLQVSSSAGGLWSIDSPVGRNALLPPVRFGEVPPGIIEDRPAEPLQPGFGYFVRVYRIKRDGDELVLLQAGEATFRH
jgi:hypothetical protein